MSVPKNSKDFPTQEEVIEKVLEKTEDLKRKQLKDTLKVIKDRDQLETVLIELLTSQKQKTLEKD